MSTGTYGHDNWQPHSYGSGKRHWFVARNHPDRNKREHCASDGRLIRYGSVSAAWKAADKLNAHYSSDAVESTYPR